MKKMYFLLTAVFFLQSFNFCFATPDLGQRLRLLMDFNWKFSLTDTIGADQPSFNDSKWRMLNLPHDWSIENEFIQNVPTGGGGGYLPTGVGW